VGAPLKAGMAPDAELGNGCTIEFAALDPTTGSVVTGVVLTQSSLWIEGGSGGDGTSGPFTLVDPKMLHKA
jgi:hypothetical protein